MVGLGGGVFAMIEERKQAKGKGYWTVLNYTMR